MLKLSKPVKRFALLTFLDSDKRGWYCLSGLLPLGLLIFLPAMPGLPDFTQIYLIPAVSFIAIFTAYFLGLTGLLIAITINLSAAAAVYSGAVPGATAHIPLIIALLTYSTAASAIIAYLTRNDRADRQNLEWLSAIDCLTEVYNHRYFQQRFAEEMARAMRSKSALTLVFVDVDYFKSYNDINGHIMGDIALKKTASFLNRETRTHDIVCRYGGDEFVIILPETGTADAAVFTRRLVENYATYTLAEMTGRSAADAGLTLSVGLSSYPSQGQSIKELIQQADKALFAAKEAGRNTMRIYGSDTPEGSGATDTSFCFNACENTLVKSYRTILNDLSVKKDQSAIYSAISENGNGKNGKFQVTAKGNGNGNGDSKGSNENSLLIGKALGLGHTKMDPSRLSTCLSDLKLN
jgi:diguanylate cyclase (GGDEF)-like protein